MKSFVVGLVLAVGLAAGAGLVLEGWFAQEADHAYARPSARVGHEESIEARNFTGRGDGGEEIRRQ